MTSFDPSPFRQISHAFRHAAHAAQTNPMDPKLRELKLRELKLRKLKLQELRF